MNGDALHRTVRRTERDCTRNTAALAGATRQHRNLERLTTTVGPVESAPPVSVFDGSEPEVGELDAVDVDDDVDVDGLAVIDGYETKGVALELRLEVHRCDGRSRPAEPDGAGDRVVLEVEQVVGHAGMSTADVCHLVFGAVCSCLAREQSTDRPGPLQSCEVGDLKMSAQGGWEGHERQIECSLEDDECRGHITLDVPVHLRLPLRQGGERAHLVAGHALFVRVHLDTDFAGDTDDAAALVMLLGRPDAELVGITTTADPDGVRAGYVRYVLGLAGRDDIPVATGAGASLGGTAMGDLPSHGAYW